jgi:hypothetical protein
MKVTLKDLRDPRRSVESRVLVARNTVVHGRSLGETRVVLLDLLSM